MLVCSAVIAGSQIEIATGGVVILGAVVSYFGWKFMARFACGRVRKDYDRDPGSAAELYKHPTYEAWLAAQSWIIRRFS